MRPWNLGKSPGILEKVLIGWNSEQPGLVESVPAHDKEAGMR